jgi:hypothetical protein
MGSVGHNSTGNGQLGYFGQEGGSVLEEASLPNKFHGFIRMTLLCNGLLLRYLGQIKCPSWKKVKYSITLLPSRLEGFDLAPAFGRGSHRLHEKHALAIQIWSAVARHRFLSLFLSSFPGCCQKKKAVSSHRTPKGRVGVSPFRPLTFSLA